MEEEKVRMTSPKRRGVADWVSTRFKSIDIYGERVGLLTNGEDSHKTFLGAFLTLAIIAVSIQYAWERFITMKDYGATTHLLTVDK